jgi:hypothetical protein
VFPPLGLVLLWMCGDRRVSKRVVATLGITVIAIVELFYVYGMRVVWNGTMAFMSVTFDSRSRQTARLEADRARQLAEALPPTSVESTPAAPLPVRVPEKIRPVAYWTDFRGPGRAGVYTQTEIDSAWPTGGLPRL